MAKLKIGAITFDVKYLKEVWYKEEDIEPYTCWGSINYDKQKIEIQKGLSEEREKLALLHETIHAVDKEYQTQLTEPTVACLASGIIDAFQRNKWLREKLLNE